MGLDLDPAALAGLACFVALAGWVAGWAAGRMQAGGAGSAGRQDVPTVPAEAAPETAPAPATTPATVIAQASAGAACQQRALEERRELLDRPVSLADLHAEVSAIRRDERILQRAPLVDAWLMMTPADRAADCRFIGLSGRPTCPASSCEDCQGPVARQTPSTAPAIMAMPERC